MLVMLVVSVDSHSCYEPMVPARIANRAPRSCNQLFRTTFARRADMPLKLGAKQGQQGLWEELDSHIGRRYRCDFYLLIPRTPTFWFHHPPSTGV